MRNFLPRFIPKAALSAAIVLSGWTTAYAAIPLPDFTVDPSVFSPIASTFVADKLNGGYSENATFTAATPLTGSFKASAYINWGQFFKDDGSTGLNAATTGLGFYYGLYALFSGTGTYSNDGAGTTKFVFNSAAFNLYADKTLDDTFAIASPSTGSIGDVTVTNPAGAGDDPLLMSASSLSSGNGQFLNNVGGTTAGSFGVFFDDVALTATGSTYFVQPNPFYLNLHSNGDIDGFTLPVAAVETQNITGDISAVFALPEPTSVALLGIGLLGVGVASRRGHRVRTAAC